MKSIWFVAGCLLLAAAPVARAQAKGKRIAVAAFHAPDAARARSAVLEVLSEHDDVEVVSLEDLEFESKRLKADLNNLEGRRKLSSEVGIDAWLDGTIEDGSARFTLQAPDGHLIASTALTGHKASVAAGLAGPKVWAAMGPWLSARERGKRALEAQGELALKKVKARDQELVRLRQVVEKRAADRVAQLKAAQALAREKRSAFEAELDRQRTLVSERLAAAEKQRKQDERKKAEAEEAEFMASLHESSGPPPPAPAEVAPAPSAWGGSAAPASIAHGSSVWTASASAPSRPTGSHWSAAPAPASNGLSPATQRWLMAQGGPAQAAAAPRYVPAPPPAAVPANTDGLSPATRAWLEQQQQR